MSSEGDDDPRNASLPADDFGFPMDPDLRHLRYKGAGLHRRDRAERQAYEDRMRRGVQYAREYGMADDTWEHWLLYL